MKPVNIVALDDILHNLADEVAAFLESRIEQRQAIVIKRPFRMAHNNMIGSVLMGRFSLGPIGINPCM